MPTPASFSLIVVEAVRMGLILGEEAAMSSAPIQFGFEEEWNTFAENHPVFLKKVQYLFDMFRKVFNRRMRSDSRAQVVVFFLGRSAVEDFMEILLLCGNGYGIGGLKLLRGLYERAVTAAYIAQNPDEVGTFLEFHYVHMGKLFNHANRLFDMSSLFTPEKVEEIQQSYKKAKDKFQEPLCKKCGTTRTQFSWTTLDLGSMARKAKEDLGKLYLPCYFQPTLQAHSTVSSLLARLSEEEGGGITFNEGTQHDKADEALIGAHNVMLSVLDTQNSYFKLGLEEEVQQRRADFMDVWGKH
jgi:hypothetical protein